MLSEALKLYGTIETPGPVSNPTILEWAKEIGLKNTEYAEDEIPWCGLFIAVCAKRASWEIPKGPLWALNWSNFGSKQPPTGAVLGDVLVFKRGGGGHVALYVGEDSSHFHCLGGNQSDAVTIKRIEKARLHSVNRPKWRVAQPPNVRKVFLERSGETSTKET